MKTFLRQLFLGTIVVLNLSCAAFAQEPPVPPPATESGVVAPPASSKKPDEPLRRLDLPAAEPVDPAPAVSDPTPAAERRGTEHTGSPRVTIGGDATLAKGEKADAVVAVFGQATNAGEVVNAVVSVFGGTRVTGPVGQGAVSVFGNNYVNAKVGGEVVAVFGNIELGPDADIGGDIVSIGGTVTRDPQAVVHGSLHDIGIGSHFDGGSAGLSAWFHSCVMYARPLAFGPHLGWAWVVALGFLALYFFLALLFGGAVEQGVQTFEQRPGYSLLAAFLTGLLAPVVIVLIACTGVGLLLVPFIVLGLIFGTLFGKAVMLAWLGRRFTRFCGDGPFRHAAVAVLVGGSIVLVLYVVPVLGVIIFKLLGWLGLGVVIYTLLLAMKREKAATAAAQAASAATAASAAAANAASAAPVILPAAPAALVPPIISATTLPRAGFWIRMAALGLDAVLLAIVLGGMLSASFPVFLIGLAAYGAIMWRFKGTTIGGVVCGLKVVRLDGRELDWSVAIVRSLACFLSLVVLGLGFIWVVFDDERQSWHDKIAGTTVVRVPKGIALI